MTFDKFCHLQKQKWVRLCQLLTMTLLIQLTHGGLRGYEEENSGDDEEIMVLRDEGEIEKRTLRNERRQVRRHRNERKGTFRNLPVDQENPIENPIKPDKNEDTEKNDRTIEN